MNLEGRVALVTGSATGIGRAIAERFARADAKVAVNYRASRAPAEELVSQLRSAGAKAIAIQADVSKDAEVRTMLAQVEREFGRLDVLVNNAGWSTRVPHRDLDQLTNGIWDKTFDINLYGVFYCIRAAVPFLRKQPGAAIVNVASVAGSTGVGSSIAYAAAKAGMLGLTRITAAEAARKGVRVNAICPGPVTETRMSKELGNTLATKLGVSPKEQLAGFLNTILQGRGQTADEVARAALFLCSALSSAITGQSINVDGGAAFF